MGMQKMTPFTAVAIAEGFEEAETEEQVIEAWQFIYDQKLYLHLQGWFGRQVESLLEAGVIG